MTVVCMCLSSVLVLEPRLCAAGAVVACVACTRTDDELHHVLHDQNDLYREVGSCGPFHGSKLWKLRQLLKKGRMYDYASFHEHMAWFSRGLTFREVCGVPRALYHPHCRPLSWHLYAHLARHSPLSTLPPSAPAT